MNNKHVLSGCYWILFSNPPLKFELDKVEECCWRVGSRCQNPWIIRMLSEFYFCFPSILATRLLFFNPPVKFDLIKLWDATDWSVPDVRISEQYVRRLWRVGIGCQTIWKRNVCSIKLHLFCYPWLLQSWHFFQTRPWNMIRLRDDSDGWVPNVSTYLIFEKNILPRPPLRSRLLGMLWRAEPSINLAQ
jgi:hypothetical protein